ncbi:MAG: Cof-type HAD-IIB family hydrolase [Lachnospiraceae bacterium]|nr:Cof-type HAD-IIB family hydrolase [Lachnospiraceae bacterium]
MNSNIKLIATDLDGTLLNSQKQLTQPLLNAISKLQNNGIVFVPTTGRVLSSVPDEVKAIESLKYIITSNGAAINNLHTGEEIASCPIPENALMGVIKKASTLPIMMEIFYKGNAYAEKKFIDNLSNYGVVGWHVDYVLSTRTPINSTLEFAKENATQIENINLIFADPTLRLNFKQYLEEKDFATVTSSSHSNLEITNKLATKGNALNTLCNKLNILPSQVAAFGDSSNDYDMLKFAGLSVAMENGEEHIKKIANHVTSSCDENGVLAAIERFIL